MSNTSLTQPDSTRKAALIIGGGVLVLLVLGSISLYLQWMAPAQPVAIPTTLPANAPSPDLQRFLRLVQSDDVPQAAVMLAKNPSLAKQKRRGDGVTPLHLARSVAMAKLLLDNGADINARDARYSATPVRWAAGDLDVELTRFLQSRGAREPDIYFAAAVGDVAQMGKLLAGDPTLIDEATDDNDVLFGGCAPLQIAAYAGQLEAARFLLDHGADVHNRTGWNNTEPLEKAAFTGRADLVALLLEHGARVDGTDGDFTNSPLYNAAAMGHADVVKILLAHGAAGSPKLVAEVRDAIQHPRHIGFPIGTPAEYQQVLSMVKAVASTQAVMP